MDSYIEQSVAGERRAGRAVLYVFCWCVSVLLVVLAMFFGTGVFGDSPDSLEISWLNFFLLGVCLLAAIGVFRWKDRLRMEYDYILRGDILEISGVFNGRRRRILAEIPLERILQIGPVEGAGLQNSTAKSHDWCLNADASKYYLIYMNQNSRRLALLELNDELAAAIQKSGKLSRDAWRKKEGKSFNYASLS